MKPYTTYNGGKAGNGTYQAIINHIPKCEVFIDAMVGNGGIFFNLNLPALTVINDIDISLIDRYNDTSATKAAVIVECADYAGIIAKYDEWRRKVFIYFDPPYLFETRKSGKRLYKHEWSETEHIRFLKLAVKVKSDVMISHYPCKLYNEYLNGWNHFDFESMTRNGMATERIYMNYPKPHILQDYRYLGSDFRDRQRIKRKISRYIKKLEGLPESERTGILSAVIAKYDVTAATLLNQEVTVKNDVTAATLLNQEVTVKNDVVVPHSYK
jgi:site-specific DNA-adenine methylase